MEENISYKFKNIFKGIILSFCFTIISLLIFSVVLTYTNLSENFITPTIIVTTAISIFLGSSIGNLKMQKNGILNGGLIGGIYMLILYLISGIINKDFILSTEGIVLVIVGILFGIIGGIVGINTKNK